MTHTRVNGTPRPAAPSLPVSPPESVSDRAAPVHTTSGGQRVRLRRTRAAGRALRTLATDERTGTVLRAAVRHSMYVAGGTRIITRRTWDGRTVSRYERMMRAAEAAGNTELAQEWEERAHRFRDGRHKRRMELLTAAPGIAKSATVAVLATQGGLVLLGGALAVANEDIRDVLAPTMAVIELVRWLVLIGSVVWGPLLMALPWMVLAALWGVGRKQQAAPNWALPARQQSGGAPITPSIVVTALRDLGVPALRKAIIAMGDAGAAMLSPISIAGCGVEVDVSLPSGSSTEEVMNRRRKLAENLGRHEHEVHVSVAPAARTVRLWIADSGALDEPVPASPLVTDTELTANYKTGRAPWGPNLRGDLAGLSLYQKHVLITGLSNQGKTASLRALALWLALDPTVEFRIGDLKGIGDWGMFAGLATVLIEGPTDGHVADVTEMVEDAFDEMQRRIQAPPGTTFHPIVVIVDEAQVAYGCGAKDDRKRPYGGATGTSRYFQAVKGIHDQGRAVNVTIWEGTQDPTNENLPKRSREGNHIRASLVLGTKSQAEMALGDNAVEAGAAPHKLRQGLDKGQVVVAGAGLQLAPGQVAMNVRTHFIDDDDAKAVADRAKARRSDVHTKARVEAAERPDHLADIALVLGDADRMRTEEVRQRLAEHNPGEYREWTASDLRAVLDAVQAPPYKSDGRMVVSRHSVQEALDARESEQANPENE
ncbi:ATP-binding protein [Streptomyces sp. NBC_01775]|uniref:ATP-binding protein n=1 Tax=Streptomyces sp. NBC_01775 TaxID=2975939 RepID=UPI002DDA650C|nr:ATP-binding protein [Streptomyces sp. NBC_01775]WSB78317.1 ATP-binding protein [Streptomyces sp. NBC_01775]